MAECYRLARADSFIDDSNPRLLASTTLLAKLAGIIFEHLCRIETGKHVPCVSTIDKIDRALRRAGRRVKKATKKGG